MEFTIIIEAALAVLLLCTLLILIYTTRRVSLKPLPKPDGSELFSVVAAKGKAEQLEQTVKGFIRLREYGDVCGRIIITDCGLEPSARKTAELLARSEFVTVCRPRELPEVLEEYGWTGNT